MQFGMLCYWKTHALKNYQENIPFVWNVLSLELIVFGIFKKEKKIIPILYVLKFKSIYGKPYNQMSSRLVNLSFKTDKANMIQERCSLQVLNATQNSNV